MPVSNAELLAKLDAQQLCVATDFSAPMVVRAGAGTGKTRAITYRIANAIHTGVYDPTAILAVTFTNKAAGEMRGRLRELGAGGVQALTFHAAALAQLHTYWEYVIGGYVPEIKEYKAPLVAEAARRLDLGTDEITIRNLTTEIDWSKSSLIAPEDYAQAARAARRLATLTHSAEDIAKLIEIYEDVKTERGVIDFEDVILTLIGIMTSYSDITAEIRKTYKHFVVDEYQDVSPMQHRLLQLWLGESKDLCVVGDVSQTIYSFAGAASSYLADFKQEFPRAIEVVLHRDYRSTPHIVDLANRIIVADENPAAVTLTSMVPVGKPVHWYCAADDMQEATVIAQTVKRLHKAGTKFADMAILYRTNFQSQIFQDALTAVGVPFSLRGSDKFFQTKSVMQTILQLDIEARQDNQDEMPQVVESVLFDRGWRKNPPAVHSADYENWEYLNTILELAKSLWAKKQMSLVDFVTELKERRDTQNAPQTNSVTLCSLHAAKGLEWENVFLAGMSEGLMPISLAKDPLLIAEERRLLYVGVTRAKQQLFISYAEDNGGRGERQCSRFLAHLWGKRATSVKLQKELDEVRQKELLTSYSGDYELFAQLLEWREYQAKEKNISPKSILSDEILRQIAITKPHNLHELSQIRGVGATKITQYGIEILRLLN